MKKIGIFYGSTTGATRQAAHKIATALGLSESDVHDVAESAPSEVSPYDILLLGTSTWGDGELQRDWYDFADGLEGTTLQGKEVAFFGCGDENMTDTFCNAVGELYRRIIPLGAKPIGEFNTDGYTFHHTDADINGHIVGLLLDQVNHPELTDERIRTWTDSIRNA